MLLAPIARLLDISLDTLLSFHGDLTAEEVQEIVYELDERLKKETFSDAFCWVKKKLEQYPSCGQLLLSAAVILDVQCMVQKLPQAEVYEEYISSLYHRALESSDEAVRIRAADALAAFYRRKKECDKAEKYLEYFSMQNPMRKMQQALLYEEADRVEEAYKAYEELLFEDYQRISAELQGMYRLALKEGNKKRASLFVEKQVEMAKCFAMGKYYEALPRFDLAVLEKDREALLAIRKDMLVSAEQIGNFRNSPLFEHMKFKEPRKEFLEGLKENLQKSFAEILEEIEKQDKGE